jgi:hypothetical protein
MFYYHLKPQPSKVKASSKLYYDSTSNLRFTDAQPFMASAFSMLEVMTDRQVSNARLVINSCYPGTSSSAK